MLSRYPVIAPPLILKKLNEKNMDRKLDVFSQAFLLKHLFSSLIFQIFFHGDK